MVFTDLLEGVMREVSDAPPVPAEVTRISVSTDVVAACLVLEAGGEGQAGMIAVMNVIQNRSARKKEEISLVVLEPHQLSCFNGLDADVEKQIVKAHRHSHWLLAQKIVQAAEGGKLPDITDGATHYWASSGSNAVKEPVWAKGMKVTRVIGHHTFAR